MARAFWKHVVRVEAIEEPLMWEISYLDKLIDELAREKVIWCYFTGAWE